MTTPQNDLIPHFATAAREILATDWITTVVPDMTAPEAAAALRAGADRVFHAIACAHRSGDKNATTALIGVNSRALGQLAKYALTDDPEERVQVALEAYLNALDAITVRTYAASKTYYFALKMITKRAQSVPAVSVESVTLEHTVACDEAWERDAVLDASGVLDFAVEYGLPCTDAEVLRHAHCRDKKVSVRILATQLGVTEHKLESQLRRAKERAREVLLEHADMLDVYLLQRARRIAGVALEASSATQSTSVAA